MDFIMTLSEKRQPPRITNSDRMTIPVSVFFVYYYERMKWESMIRLHMNVGLCVKLSFRGGFSRCSTVPYPV
jgi:hypothetical protein